MSQNKYSLIVATSFKLPLLTQNFFSEVQYSDPRQAVSDKSFRSPYKYYISLRLLSFHHRCCFKSGREYEAAKMFKLDNPANNGFMRKTFLH